MAQSDKRKIPIKYTSRDFNSIKNDLVEYARRYYGESYKDFNESSFGSLLLDTVAYTGDVLSFYLDFAANESFLDSAVEYNNVLRLGRQLGYRFRGRATSTGLQTFYVIVPANSTGLGPDMDYVPVLQRGTTVSTISGNQFILIENIDFSNSDNEVVVSEVDETTGVPTSYAIKAVGRVISGEIVEEFHTVGDFREFFKLKLTTNDVAEIISVTDSEGHDYYEVDYLSQNVVYTAIVNRGEDKNSAPNLLKPIVVPRRYVVEQDRENTTLQFGYGSSENLSLTSVVDPTEVVLQLHGRTYNTDDSFDPTKLLESDKFGVAPSNTTLRVVIRRNTENNVNAATNTVTEVVTPLFEFENITSLNNATVGDIITSLEVTNESPIIGEVDLPTADELKVRIMNTFAAQNRAVTREDYKACVYRMPVEYGAIKRVNVVQDHDSFKRNLNMYVVSENSNKTLVEASSTLKNNLKVWLNQVKMINDTIDLLDATIVNIGINFEIVTTLEANKYSVLSQTTARLSEKYNSFLDIGEPFSITDVFTTLKEVDGVADVVKVEVVKKIGDAYSDASFNVDEYMSQDGRFLYAPENVIFEIKYPKVDLVGSVV